MKLKDLTVIVTGASAGIGRATAEHLAAAGANVVLTARRVDRLQVLQAELANLPSRRLSLAGDIRDEAFAQYLARETMAEFGRIDVLVNCAGLGHDTLISDLNPSDAKTLLDTNLLGMLFAIQAALPYMKSQRSGQVVNVSSIVSQRPLPRRALYCASKTAVNFLSRGLRIELRPYNIRVTLVYPGRTLTEFGHSQLGKKGANPSPFGRVSADRVGRVITNAIRDGREEVYITWYDWLFTHLNRLFPRSADWLTAKLSTVVPGSSSDSFISYDTPVDSEGVESR